MPFLQISDFKATFKLSRFSKGRTDFEKRGLKMSKNVLILPVPERKMTKVELLLRARPRWTALCNTFTQMCVSKSPQLILILFIQGELENFFLN